MPKEPRASTTQWLHRLEVLPTHRRRAVVGVARLADADDAVPDAPKVSVVVDHNLRAYGRTRIGRATVQRANVLDPAVACVQVQPARPEVSLQ